MRIFVVLRKLWREDPVYAILQTGLFGVMALCLAAIGLICVGSLR